MKLATFDAGAGDHVGIVDGDEVVDLTAADPSLATMIDLLDRGPHQAAASSSQAPRLALSSVKLRPPVPHPPKFLAIGYNYAAHLDETHMPRPTRQAWFTSLVGQPPMTYVLHWRMAVACDALRFSGRSLDEIALAAGYGSASAFSTAFTRTIGRSPARFARDPGQARGERYMESISS